MLHRACETRRLAKKSIKLGYPKNCFNYRVMCPEYVDSNVDWWLGVHILPRPVCLKTTLIMVGQNINLTSSVPIYHCLVKTGHQREGWSVLVPSHHCNKVLFLTSQGTTKTTEWPVCPAKTKISLGIPQSDQNLCCLPEESLGLWLEWQAKTLIRRSRCPGWSESLVILLVVLCFC